MSNGAVVITGGGGSLGRASATELARQGYDVVVTGRTRESLEETVAAVGAAGGRARAVAGDASDEEHVREVFEQTIDAYGHCAGLVHAVGFHGEPLALVDVPAGEWDEVLKMNLRSAFLCSREAVRVMLGAERGSIVLVGSPGTIKGFPVSAPYSAAKSALLGFARSVASEVSPHGVRVNVLTPGPTPEAAIFRDAMPKIAAAMGTDPDASADSLREMTALRTVCTPEKLARVVSFLISEDSSLMTGQALVSDAGLTV